MTPIPDRIALTLRTGIGAGAPMWEASLTLLQTLPFPDLLGYTEPFRALGFYLIP